MRVLIVDDSAVIRALLRMTMAAIPGVEIAAMAADGAAGLEAIDRLRPDLVLLDLEMPRMDGLEVLARLRPRRSRPRVIVCSTLTRRGAEITLDALAAGATDYVAKPTGGHSPREGVESLRRELLPKIRALFPAALPAPLLSAPLVSAEPRKATRPASDAAFRPGVVVVGVSTGGPAALEKFLPALPPDFSLPVLIAQHMPPIFTALLAERLNGLCALPVSEAQSGEPMRPGTVTLARGDWHLGIAGSVGHCSLRLTRVLPDELCRPSVDVLFRSAAAVFGPNVLAVVLTGMGSDGLDGCRAVHAAGGRILTQDRETSAVWGMPGVVVAAGLADKVLPLDALAAEIVRSTAYNARRPAVWDRDSVGAVVDGLYGC